MAFVRFNKRHVTLYYVIIKYLSPIVFMKHGKLYSGGS